MINFEKVPFVPLVNTEGQYNITIDPTEAARGAPQSGLEALKRRKISDDIVAISSRFLSTDFAVAISECLKSADSRTYIQVALGPDLTRDLDQLLKLKISNAVIVIVTTRPPSAAESEILSLFLNDNLEMLLLLMPTRYFVWRDLEYSLDSKLFSHLAVCLIEKKSIVDQWVSIYEQLENLNSMARTFAAKNLKPLRVFHFVGYDEKYQKATCSQIAQVEDLIEISDLPIQNQFSNQVTRQLFYFILKAEQVAWAAAQLILRLVLKVYWFSEYQYNKRILRRLPR